MKRKAIIPLILGLGIGLTTVKLAVDAIRKAQAASRNTQLVTAIRARQDIGEFEKLTAVSVEAIETADSLFAPEGERIESIEEVIGRVTAKAIPQNAAILKSMLAPEGTQPGMRGRIAAGFRAVSVKVDESTAVAYQIKPGDWVDVIVVMDIDSASRRGKETVAEVILRHVQVAAVGRSTATGESAGSGARVKPARSVTLLVADRDVPKLHLASSRGKITLAMRGEEDDPTPGGRASANMSDVLTDLSKLLGLKPGAGESSVPDKASGAGRRRTSPHSVWVYRGQLASGQPAAVQQVTFEHKNSTNIVNVSYGGPTRVQGAMDGSRTGSP